MITNGAKPLLAEQTSDHQRSNAFSGGAHKWSLNGAKLYWRSRQVVANGAQLLLKEQTSDPQRSNVFTDGAD